MKTVLCLSVVLSLLVPCAFADSSAPYPGEAGPIIILKRIGCHGPCPDYTVQIYADGKVEFEGRVFVKAMGLHVKTLPQEKVAAMLAEVEKSNFFELNGDYACYSRTDSPWYTITVTQDGRTKTIKHYEGCDSADKEGLAALNQLEDRIDELAGIADWLKYDK